MMKTPTWSGLTQAKMMVTRTQEILAILETLVILAILETLATPEIPR
jgi:hypothetical protein